MATESPDIDSIIKKMTNNGMSYEEAVSVLAEYYNTKDSSNLPNYIQSEAEQINNTDLETYLTFLSEDVSTISMDSVINSMYNSGMSYEEIISTLANYYNTGDINYIPSNLRVEFQNIPASDLETYLSRIVNNSKNKNVDISKKTTFTPAKKVENLTEFYQQLKSEISSDDRFLQFYNITEKSSIPTNLREAISYIPSSDLRSYVNGIVKNPNFTSSNASLNNLVNYLKSTGMSINEICY